jgi:hypothetical protein
MVLFRHSLEGTDENLEKICHDSGCPGRDSNWAPVGHKSEALPLS